MEYEQLRAAIRSGWAGVFLDGRNEHGTHVLPLPQAVIGEFDPQDYAEKIMQAAEHAGHVAGDAVVTVWRHVDGDYSEGGLPPHWELDVPYHAELTALIYGAPDEQASERAVDALNDNPDDWHGQPNPFTTPIDDPRMQKMIDEAATVLERK